MDRTAAFYMRPSYDFHGSGFPVFMGSRRQRGGSIFGSLKRFFTPIAKNVGRHLLSQGVGLAKDIASDALAGKNIKESILSHGKARAKDLGTTVLKQGIGTLSSMVGQGRRRRRRRRLTSKKRKKRSVLRRVRKSSRKRSRSRLSSSRKRKRRAKSAPKRSAKRRRVSFNF